MLRSERADGILLLKAAGMVGEARQVGRRIKTLLLEGTPADAIVVALRDLTPYADLLRKIFTEYGIPLDVEGAEPISRNGAIATLLRAARLPEDDWPFAGVAALLRSGYFQPRWPEARGVSEVAQRAEVLLRLLGEPRGRDAYLQATNLWADHPPPGLEDEQAEASLRKRKHELALICRPFLLRFFATWDDAPRQGRLADHVAWLRRFAEEIGWSITTVGDANGVRALRRLGTELDAWIDLEKRLYPQGRVLDRSQFHRLLGTLAGETALARTPRGPGRVRVLSAELARTLRVPYLFVMGLSERSFPNLAAPEPFFDDAERQAFRQAGLDLSCVSDRQPEEMLLFYELVTRAARSLYSAIRRWTTRDRNCCQVLFWRPCSPVSRPTR